MAELKQLADLAKNGRERVRISLSEFKGTRYVDVRVFATADDGGLVPTKQGATLRPDQVRPAIEALQEAERLLQTSGART